MFWELRIRSYRCSSNMYRQMNKENLFQTTVVFQIIFSILEEVFLINALMCMYMPLLSFEQIDFHES
jgi:hypothetical protein